MVKPPLPLISVLLVDYAITSIPIDRIIKVIRDNYSPVVIERWTEDNVHKITLRIYKDYDDIYDEQDNKNTIQTAAQIRATVISILYAKYEYLDKLENKIF